MSNIHWSKINSFNRNFSSKHLGFYRPCPICGSIDSKIILELAEFQFYSDSIEKPKLFDVIENICLNCFSLYLNPCYSQYGFDILFSEAGQSYGSMSSHTLEQIEWLNEHNFLNDDSSLLDVGCYDGYFLSQLPDNVKKLGVDIDEPAIQRGREKYKQKKIEFFLGDFEAFQFSGPSPDTITMFHVLEHLPRPVEVLKKLHSISHQNSKLVVEVPIIENGKTNDINGFFSIQHTTHFSRRSLINCLALAGWEIKEKFEIPDYNGYRVLATPNDNIRLDYSIERSKKNWLDVNETLVNWYSAVNDVEKIIQRIGHLDKIVIWGAGAHCEYLYQVTSLFHMNRKVDFIIVDSDKLKHKNTWRGIPIHDPLVLKEIDWVSTTLLISSYGDQNEIFDAACSLKVPDNRIIRLYKTIKKY